MNRYEMLYILDANLADEARDAVIAKFEELVKTNGGNVESIDKWGVKKLTYEINDKADGYYVLMTFECQPSLIAEIERIAGITGEVLRRLITKL